MKVIFTDLGPNIVYLDPSIACIRYYTVVVSIFFSIILIKPARGGQWTRKTETVIDLRIWGFEVLGCQNPETPKPYDYNVLGP